MTALGLWVDCPPEDVCAPAYWDKLIQLEVHTAALFASQLLETRFRPRYTPEEIHTACQLAIERDIAVTLTVAPVPITHELCRLGIFMDHVLGEGASAVELDLEANWRARNVEGYFSLQDATDELLQRTDTWSATHDVWIEVTSHTGHPECGRRAGVAPFVHRVFPQVYSVRHRTPVVEWGGPLAPGEFQRSWASSAYSRGVFRIEGHPSPCVGLAAWDQQWPGLRVADAMDAALGAVLPHEPEEVRYWSSKWIAGRRSNPDVWMWFRTMRNTFKRRGR